MLVQGNVRFIIGFALELFMIFGSNINIFYSLALKTGFNWNLITR